MMENWSLVTPALLPMLSKKKGIRKHIRWKDPHEGWLKLNFESSCRGNPGVSGFVVVIRNGAGELVLGSYGSLGMATNNEAEIQALLEGLNLCVSNYLSKIIIEGDSLVIIHGIIKKGFRSRNLNKWVPFISRLLNDISHYEIIHTYREANQVADCVTNLGADIPQGTVTFDLHSVPGPCTLMAAVATDRRTNNAVDLKSSLIFSDPLDHARFYKSLCGSCRKLLEQDAHIYLCVRSLKTSIPKAYPKLGLWLMAFFGDVLCVNCAEDLRGQLQDLFFTVDMTYDAMEGLVGVALNHHRHSCDSKVLEATLILVVDVLESWEKMVELLSGFVKPLLLDAVANCALSLPSDHRLSILKVYFQMENYLSFDSLDDGSSTEEEDSDNERHNRAMEKYLAKMEERDKMRVFYENAWEVFHCAVLNGNMDPFRRVTQAKDWWLSE
ncbi:hypothetical protein SUGI_1033710 [Cryptomeria japonica]|nr:hypothetical protein SUGI_1033710 [Cryptomeria japonica]